MDQCSQSINNSAALVSNLSALYREKKNTDLCLVLGGREFSCHRLILCASSNVFQVMLTNAPWSESFESRVELFELAECVDNFDDFLGFFYSGEITVTLNSVTSIFMLADKYNVEALRDSLIKYMTENVAMAAGEGLLLSWTHIAHNLGYSNLEKTCRNFLKWNLNLSERKLFANSSHISLNDAAQFLIGLIQQSDLVVHDEFILYRFVVDWLEVLCRRCHGEDEIKSLVMEVIGNIRFGMMTDSQLTTLNECRLAQNYAQFFNCFLNTCLAGSWTSERGYLQITPRLYTAYSHSSILTIEDYSTIADYHTTTLVFSSHTGLADHEDDRGCEWVVDVHPKGVRMKQCYLIEWEGKVELPEVVLKTVRVSITCKDPPPYPDDLRVKIGILIYGVENGIECIGAVVERVHYFSDSDRVLRLDDVIPFHLLNPSQGPSQFLVGANRDIFKLHVIIQPLNYPQTAT